MIASVRRVEKISRNGVRPNDNWIILLDVSHNNSPVSRVTGGDQLLSDDATLSTPSPFSSSPTS